MAPQTLDNKEAANVSRDWTNTFPIPLSLGSLETRCPQCQHEAARYLNNVPIPALPLSLFFSSFLIKQILEYVSILSKLHLTLTWQQAGMPHPIDLEHYKRVYLPLLSHRSLSLHSHLSAPWALLPSPLSPCGHGWPLTPNLCPE